MVVLTCFVDVFVSDLVIAKNIKKYNKSFVTTVPNLLEVQLNSYCWFLEYGLGDELNKFSSILDLNKNLEIRIFGHERVFCYPRYTEFQCKKYDLSIYEVSRPIRARQTRFLAR